MMRSKSFDTHKVREISRKEAGEIENINLSYKSLRPYRNICVNDIVILVDQGTPRSQRSLGRVVKIFPDTEGIVCSV